jgi:hypothetical protein
MYIAGPPQSMSNWTEHLESVRIPNFNNKNGVYG